MPASSEQTGATLKFRDVELSGPTGLIDKALYLGCAFGSLWFWFWTLDASRPFFEKKGYSRIAQGILALKVLGFVLFVAFIVACFLTKRI